MTRRTRSLVAGAVVAAVTLTAGMASAVGAPRLEGATRVEMTITAHENTIDVVGATYTRSWKFTPNCAGPDGCDTILARHRNTSAAVTEYTLRVGLIGDVWHYKGRTRARLSCITDTGQVVVPNSMRSVERIDLRVTRISTANNVVRFKGRFRADFTPTPKAQAAGCNPKGLPSWVTARFNNITTPS